jgi:NAD(P)-dependent dehydrogenase (short-subunit alcohol dehydrogenase family)
MPTEGMAVAGLMPTAATEDGGGSAAMTQCDRPSPHPNGQASSAHFGNRAPVFLLALGRIAKSVVGRSRMSGRLDGKVAIVTGGGGGIGEATGALFREQGASVAMVDNNADDLEHAVRAISDDPAERILSVVADITQESEAARIVSATVERFGRLDVLVNIAGVRAPVGPITATTTEMWRHVLDVNLLGMVACCKYAVPEMVRVGGGSIINVSSINAEVARPGWAIYDASKAAVLALTRDMACDHARQGIRVNAVCPGFVLTRFHIRNRAQSQGTSYEDAETQMRSEPYPYNLMGRPGEPRELAHTLLFLASGESSYATGAVFHIDGGRGYVTA